MNTRIFAAVLCLATAACKDTVAPRVTLRGDYRASTLNDQLLPHVVVDSPTGFYAIDDWRLEFTGAYTVIETMVYRVSSTGGGGAPVTDSTKGPRRVRAIPGGRLEFSYFTTSCPGLATCAFPIDTAQIVDGALVRTANGMDRARVKFLKWEQLTSDR